MQIRHLARFACAAAATLFLSQSAAIAIEPDSGIARNAPSATVNADRAAPRVKLAQRGPMGGSASPSKGARSRAGRGSGSRGARRGRGGRGRGAFGGPRRYRGGSFYAPLSPFAYGFSSPYYYYDDYPSSGRCAYWHRRCVASWGYGNNNYYGCMRYYGCR